MTTQDTNAANAANAANALITYQRDADGEDRTREDPVQHV